MTPQQARAELARRELARRQAGTSVVEKPVGEWEVGPQAAERAIGQRHSSIKDVRGLSDFDDTGGSISALAQKFQTERPMEKMGAGIGEMLRGGVANLAMKLQQPDRSFRQDMQATLQGERPSQLGDVARASAVPLVSSPPGRFLINNADMLIPGALGARKAGMDMALRDVPKAMARAPEQIGAGLKSAASTGVDLAKKAGNFLIGNPKGIEAAKRVEGQTAQSLVKSIRPDGTLADTFWKGLKSNAQKAWEPMRQVIRAIKEPITMDELSVVAQRKFAHDPARLKNVEELIQIASNQPKPPRLFNARGDVIEFPKGTWSAKELDELSSEFSQSMRKTVKQGNQARDTADQLLADARSVIADTLEAKAPENMKDLIGKAKSQWSSYATDRDTAFRLFRPAAPKEAFTKSGVSALKKSSAKTPGAEDEMEFFERLNKNFGIDLMGAMRPATQGVRKAEAIGLGGKATAGVGTLAGGTGLLKLFGLLGKSE